MVERSYELFAYEFISLKGQRDTFIAKSDTSSEIRSQVLNCVLCEHFSGTCSISRTITDHGSFYLIQNFFGGQANGVLAQFRIFNFVRPIVGLKWFFVRCDCSSNSLTRLKFRLSSPGRVETPKDGQKTGKRC